MRKPRDSLWYMAVAGCFLAMRWLSGLLHSWRIYTKSCTTQQFRNQTGIAPTGNGKTQRKQRRLVRLVHASTQWTTFILNPKAFLSSFSPAFRGRRFKIRLHRVIVSLQKIRYLSLPLSSSYQTLPPDKNPPELSI